MRGDVERDMGAQASSYRLAIEGGDHTCFTKRHLVDAILLHRCALDARHCPGAPAKRMALQL